MSDLKVGDKAPDFSVVNDVNETVNLKDLAGQKVILYFYPKDNTPGCSIEAQQFNEAYKKIARCRLCCFGCQSRHGKTSCEL